MDYYEILGVPKSATADEIKAAYRSLAQKYHPDKEDGDEEKFKAINRASEVLSDFEKRARYDAGKDPDGVGGIQREEALSALFMKMLDQLGDSADIIEEMRNHFRKQKASIDNDIRQFQLAIRRREKTIKKVVRKTGGNFIAEHIRKDIEQKQRLIENCEKMMGQCDELLDDLKDFIFEREAGARTPTYLTIGSLMS